MLINKLHKQIVVSNIVMAIISKNLLLLLLVFSTVFSACSQEIKHNINFEQEGELWILPSEMHDSLYIKIEFAQEDSEMMQGLMYRDSMNSDEGMLFLYPYSQEMYFWMKNTQIPLDLIFINEDGVIVDLAERTTPFSEENIHSQVLSKYVLEVNAAYCAENYIIIGDRVKWRKLEK